MYTIICSMSIKKGREYTRHLVRKRDNFTCQDCNVTRTPEQARIEKRKSFDIHHINGMCGKLSRGYDRVADISGLITLCHKCHFNRHDWQPRIKRDKMSVSIN